jgi:hypothetical protein
LFLFVSLRPHWPFIFFGRRERRKLPDFLGETQRRSLIDNFGFFREAWIGDGGASLAHKQLHDITGELCRVARP